MQVILFGCKDTTLHISNLLLKKGARITLITISPLKAKEQKVAGYEDLTKYVHLFEKIYVAKRYDLKDEDDLNFFKSSNLNVGFSMGWQRLIPSEILDLFNCGVFGMHGSSMDLPFGKGRSPLNWSIIENRKWFYTNLFKYQSGVDNGPVVDKECFSINDYDSAETLHYKNLISFTNIILNNWENFKNNNLKTIPQKKIKGSFYPKRDPEDSIIDWEDDIFQIERFIRAVSPPFNGSYSFLNDKKLIILRASIFYSDLEYHSFKNFSRGYICQIFPNGKFLVRANGGVLIIHEYFFEDKIIEAQLKSPVNLIKRFKKNNYGFYDI
tara:strand:- start:166 stop:1140 length:975 start_codon:yes stop_codon:yes gene_type:complete